MAFEARFAIGVPTEPTFRARSPRQRWPMRFRTLSRQHTDVRDLFERRRDLMDDWASYCNDA